MSWLAGLAKCNDVNGVTPLDQSPCVLLNARVRLVERIRKHADFHRIMARAYEVEHMTGRNVLR
jgi:hypothetical protein